jgi:anti-sigma B factor antagonist
MRKTELGPGVICVEVDGDLDMRLAYEFDLQLQRIEANGTTTLVLDMRGVKFVDSSGLARILAAARRADKAGRRLVLVRGAKPVERLFALTGIEQRFEMVRDPADVLESA